MDVVLLQHVDELGEGGGDPHAGLVLHTLEALLQGLLDDEGQIPPLLLVFGLPQVHEHGDEGGLAIGGQQSEHLILDGLHTAAYLVPQTLFIRQQFQKFRNFLCLFLHSRTPPSGA